MSPSIANVVLLDRYITNIGIWKSSIDDPLIGYTLEKVSLDKNMYHSDPMVSKVMHDEEDKLHKKQVNTDISTVREMDMVEKFKINKITKKKYRYENNLKMSSELNKGNLEETNHQMVKQENENT